MTGLLPFRAFNCSRNPLYSQCLDGHVREATMRGCALLDSDDVAGIPLASSEAGLGKLSQLGVCGVLRVVGKSWRAGISLGR